MPTTSSLPTSHAPAAPASPRTGFAIDVPDSLLARARAGEQAAFEQLYRWFERPVFTLALRMCGDREEAAEVLQDTMLKVLNRVAEFRGGGSPFWAWLRQIAVNEALMRLRSRRTHGEVAIEDEHALEDHAPPPPAAADAAQLQRALAQLPAMTRSVLWLYHAEGYTHEEIAVLMQRTASFSKSQLARGGRRLRQLLESNPPAETARSAGNAAVATFEVRHA
ncbi:RNA polymerase sigma factor [Lysobacter solisilvae (ex Woo and Kim 2020)]|uniref:Sigma-70 family RNA polymerase sigma factor n=1 Tax=Agrilutibacter terrestris TaxID=2865112 RepID=A0A7H0FUW8_9GAMM|nr:sigma-70 family RNA polymerase sigma factor [Lysobacter terrestris]QNP39834.1 sigma-70 family RNA polymerase sigma factor [Lysobacter terrestris]